MSLKGDRDASSYIAALNLESFTLHIKVKLHSSVSCPGMCRRSATHAQAKLGTNRSTVLPGP